MDLSRSAVQIETILKSEGLSTLARVQESRRAIDLAIATPQSTLAAVRIVLTPEQSDYAALTRMIADGDFSRAMLVCCEHDCSVHDVEFETWSISDAAAMASSLAQRFTS